MRRMPARASVALIIASDGVEWLRRVFRRHDAVSRRIDELEAKLFARPHSDKLRLKLIERIIGEGAEATARGMDAMFQADFVVTKSSSFPIPLCAIGGAELISLDIWRCLDPAVISRRR